VKLSLFWKGFIFVLAAVILVGGVVFANRILAGDAFTKEEAQHALYGYWLARDIQTLNLSAFCYDTQRQMVWPFLHSWLLSIFFLIFGTSYVSARLLSLFLFFGTVILIYLLSDKLCDEKGWKVGIVASLMALTSPMMIRFATENMIEALGAFLFIAAAYLYMHSEERKITIEYLFLAVLIGLSIYTSYLYAYLLIPAFLVMTLVKLGPLTREAVRLKKLGEEHAVHFIWWSYRKAIVLGVILVFCGLWFSVSFSRKVSLLITSIFRSSGGVVVPGIWQNLFYYPKVIISQVSFSPWLGALVLASLLLPNIIFHYKQLKRVYSYVLTVILLLTLTISVKAPQMIFIIVPLLFIIAAAVLVYLFEVIRQNNPRGALAFLLILLLPAAVSLPQAYAAWFPERQPQNLVNVMEFFELQVPLDASIKTELNLVRLGPETIRFHLRKHKDVLLSDLSIIDGEMLDNAAYYLTIELDPGSIYQKDVQDDSLLRWNDWLMVKQMNEEITLYSSRRFNSIDLTAKIYKPVLK